MLSNIDVFERIAEQYNSLTNVEQRIADYVLKYKNAAKPLGILDIATACDVSKASVTRFCHSIGLKSFSELKWDLGATLINTTSEDAGRGTPTDIYDDIMPDDGVSLKCQKLLHINTQALVQTMAQIDLDAITAAVKLLCDADNVFCYGQGSSSTLASDAWSRFSYVTTKFHWIADFHMQAYTTSLLGPKDVVLFFSFSGTTKELIEIGKLLQGTGAKMILVTRFPNSLGAAYADIVLICGVNETPKSEGSVAAKIGQLFIIDILFNEFCSNNQDAYFNSKKKLDKPKAFLHIKE